MRILVADDDRISRRLIETTLTGWGHEVVAAANGNEAWQILSRRDRPPLAILDWMMPGMDGLEVCRKVRGESGRPYVYILLLTAKDQKEDMVRGMRAGADDYVTKPFDPHELEVRLRAGRRILDLQADLIAAREAVRTQATHDPLTGLWNRTAIRSILHRELARARRQGPPLALAVIDVDHFKHVNDTFGHVVGDAVLREVAKRMAAVTRPYDAIARYGGDEFLLLLPGCDRPTATGLTRRIRARICESPMDTPNGKIVITASIGVATTGEVSSTHVDRLIGSADMALYRAKDRGRNRVEAASAEHVPPARVGPALT